MDTVYTISKQVCKLKNQEDGIYTVRLADLTRYGTTWEYFSHLVELAKQDFPGLKDRDITIQIYGGDRHKGMKGIEFQRKTKLVPNSYVVVEKFDPTY
jgi:hypothetical protein